MTVTRIGKEESRFPSQVTSYRRLAPSFLKKFHNIRTFRTSNDDEWQKVHCTMKGIPIQINLRVFHRFLPYPASSRRSSTWIDQALREFKAFHRPFRLILEEEVVSSSWRVKYIRKKKKVKSPKRKEELQGFEEDWTNVPFCSRSLMLFILLTRGRKLVGSRLKVISSDARNRFMPDSKDCGLYAQHTLVP